MRGQDRTDGLRIRTPTLLIQLSYTHIKPGAYLSIGEESNLSPRTRFSASSCGLEPQMGYVVQTGDARGTPTHIIFVRTEVLYALR